MKSFRTELENPVVEKDIIDLERKIRLYKEGKIHEDRFRSLRLARGIYGQRQPGVQMIRIKLPYGRVTSEQLSRICAVSEEYSDGKLHITTRQDVQIHYVSLDRTPELWAELERDSVTLREACGNTVRNVTASHTAGIDPNEPFNVIPYADAVFKHFLRNPICQELGRKFKMSFSSTDKDSAYSYIHDLGFIAKVDDHGNRGFKVLLGGGLGAQPQHAHVVDEFLPTNRIIPFIEAVIRVFDRHGERANRNKARLKFLVKELGIEQFLELVAREKLAVPFESYLIQGHEISLKPITNPWVAPNDEKFGLWLKTNTIRQKQSGYYAVTIRVSLGNIGTKTARKVAEIVKRFGQNELRFTIEQNILIPHIHQQHIYDLYNELSRLQLASPGSGGIVDITACPGTDTCNLGIASSTGITKELETVILNEYPILLDEPQFNIKISGCMNACGQHTVASIGFQGMTIKSGNFIAPALQVLLGGANLGNGIGIFADKVIKIPSKRGPQALRTLLDDYLTHRQRGELFHEYYARIGKMYFYQLLKTLADAPLDESELIDWGHREEYVKAIGIGECAGVTIDLVATLITEAQEKLILAEQAYADKRWADSVYHSYAAMINGAKAILTQKDISTNSHLGIIALFDVHFTYKGTMVEHLRLTLLAEKTKNNRPTEEFAIEYLADANEFLKVVGDIYKTNQLNHETA